MVRVTSRLGRRLSLVGVKRAGNWPCLWMGMVSNLGPIFSPDDRIGLPYLRVCTSVRMHGSDMKRCTWRRQDLANFSVHPDEMPRFIEYVDDGTGALDDCSWKSVTLQPLGFWSYSMFVYYAGIPFSYSEPLGCVTDSLKYPSMSRNW